MSKQESSSRLKGLLRRTVSGASRRSNGTNGNDSRKSSEKTKDGEGAGGAGKTEKVALASANAAVDPDFVLSEGLTSARAAELLTEHGFNELPEKHTPSWKIFCSGLIGPMPAMLWVAAIAEFGLQNFADGAILLAILFINAFIAWREKIKSDNAIAALKSSLKPVATVCRDGKWSNINSRELVPGDLVKLAAGSSVPADCVVHAGPLDVDQSSLTGESLPITLGVREAALMGCNVVRGEAEATVLNTGANTFFGRTAQLINVGQVCLFACLL